MAPARASEPNREIALALSPIKRDQKFEQFTYFRDKPARLRMRHHETVHAHVRTVERAKFGHEKRIRNEADVKEEIKPDRSTVLVAEGDQSHDHPGPAPRTHYGGRNDLAQLVHRRRGGIEHAGRPVAHLGQRQPFAPNTLADAEA